MVGRTEATAISPRPYRGGYGDSPRPYPGGYGDSPGRTRAVTTGGAPQPYRGTASVASLGTCSTRCSIRGSARLRRQRGHTLVDGATEICDRCGHRWPFRRLPLIAQNGWHRRAVRNLGPPEFEPLPPRALFSDIHDLALVAEPAVLAARLRARPAWNEPRTTETPEFDDWLRKQVATP